MKTIGSNVRPAENAKIDKATTKRRNRTSVKNGKISNEQRIKLLEMV